MNRLPSRAFFTECQTNKKFLMALSKVLIGQIENLVKSLKIVQWQNLYGVKQPCIRYFNIDVITFC